MDTYHCKFCGTDSKTSSNFAKHCRTKKHILNQAGEKKEKKIYECVFCDFRTNKKRDYDAHILTKKHENAALKQESYGCIPCNYTTKNKGNFLKHVQTTKHKNIVFTGSIISDEDVDALLKELEERSKKMFYPIVEPEKQYENSDSIRPCISPFYGDDSTLSLCIWLKKTSSSFFSSVEEENGHCIVKIKNKKWVFEKHRFFVFVLRLAQIVDAECRLKAVKEFERCLSLGFSEEKGVFTRTCSKKGEKKKCLGIDFYLSSSFSGKIWKMLKKEEAQKTNSCISANFLSFWVFDVEHQKNFMKYPDVVCTKIKEYEKIAKSSIVGNDKVFGEEFGYILDDSSFLEVVSSFSFEFPQVDEGTKVKFALDKIMDDIKPQNIEEHKFSCAFRDVLKKIVSNVTMSCCGMEELSPISKKVLRLINSK